MNRNEKRREWTAEEKLRIVLDGIQSDASVSEICRREGITPALYRSWKNLLLNSADRVFENRRRKKENAGPSIEEENQRLQKVIDEITAENLDLKKERSE